MENSRRGTRPHGSNSRTRSVRVRTFLPSATTPTCRCFACSPAQDGLLEHVLSTEPMEFKLNSFLSKIGRSPIGQLELSVVAGMRPSTRFIRCKPQLSPGSLASWVGRYQKPQENVSFTVHGVRDGIARSNDGQNQPARASRSIIRNCRGSGRAPASMPCSKKSSARVRTRPPSTKSSALRVNTNSSRPTLRFWPCRARCCVHASFARAIRFCASKPTNPSSRYRAVSVRTGAAASLSLVGRRLADALSRPHRHAGWNLHRAPHPAR